MATTTYNATKRGSSQRASRSGDGRLAGILECASCGLPFARIEHGVLIVKSVHHGETHQNVIAISDLVGLASETVR